MPVVQTAGELQAFTAPATFTPTYPSSYELGFYGRAQTYAAIYASQPNVRTCVDFLARNIAQLGIHAYRRVSDTDRVRLVNHDVVRWLTSPNPSTTRYRLIEALMGDLGIYFNAYWLKVRDAGRRLVGLVRLPPEEVVPVGGLLPSSFVWLHNNERIEYSPEDVMHFGGYNPLNPLLGLSPLETLRQILSAEAAAAENREAFWRNAGRMEGVIEQTKDAPNWTEPQQQQWRTQWQEYSAGGTKVGMAALLPKGMTLKPWSFNARDSEYSASRKLSREECAAAYHIPLPMVGILEHATFSNIKEQHKQLYSDSLGPWIEMITEEIEGYLLIESTDAQDVYVEFNIAEKLKGSFEEQAVSLQMMVGRPVMTANEGRARLNLPAIDDDSADTLAPQQGGPATVPTPTFDGTTARSREDVTVEAQPQLALSAHVERIERESWQRHATRLRKFPQADRARALNPHRCAAELTYDLHPHLGAAAATVAAETVTGWVAQLRAGTQEI